MSTDNHAKPKLSIMSALAVSAALRRQVVPEFERATNADCDMIWDPTTVLLKRISTGERADLIIATDEAVDELTERGLVLARGREPIASAVLGLGIKHGGARPDISTVDRFKAALTRARSVAYSQGGASGIYFSDLIQRLGIADAVNAKATIIPAGFTGEKIVDGHADLAIQQISELLMVQGVDVVGPFPDELQVATDFSAAIMKDSPNAEMASKFISALVSAAAGEAYQATGLIRRF